MAQVIRFPQHRHFQLGGSTRHRCILALEFVAKTIRSGEVTPTEMFIMYGTRNERATAPAREDGRLRPDASEQNEAETIWSYLNLGFDPDGLTTAMCRVLDDVEERDGEDSWD